MIQPPDAPPHAQEASLSRAGFLAGLLGALALVALSVLGIGHSRQIAGAANIEFWIVVALVAAAAGGATVGLSRTSAASRSGEALRRVAVALAAVGIALFVWEAVALGAGLKVAPYALARSLVR